jgi:capsid protein
MFGLAEFAAGHRRPESEPEVLAPSIGGTSGHLSPFRYRFDDGSKFEGGFGFTEVLLTDYWTLRQRSAQLFETNIYARGIVRRLITNEINTGLHLESTPEEVLLGKEEDDLADWAENVENRFALWENDARLCDQNERLTFGQLQAIARLEALVAGDVLVVMKQDQRTKLPRIQLINGAKIQDPFLGMNEIPGPNKIRYGVEVDPTGRQVAYWVRQDDGTSKRLPAYGEKTGRRLAWLLYGTDKRLDDVRGKPLLALVLQSLREIDRYRDATQRKALINSMLALFIKKGEDSMGTRPLAGGAVKKGAVQTIDASPDTTVRTWNFAEHVPGTVIDELAVGEEPVPFSTHGTDQAFGEFEAAILCGVAWSLELPPEILTLSFRNNYSASQAAINELKMYLNRARTDFGENFCKPVYREWLLAETLLKKIEAPGLVDAWRDPARYDEFGAWVSSEWSGHIKPAVDLTKLVNGYAEMVNQGFITRDRASRELTGSKYSKNVQKLRRENEELAEANEALAPPKPAGPKPDEPVPTVPAGAAPKTISHELPVSGEHELDVADEEERLPN